MLSDNLRDAISLCEAWYRAEPNLATFILRAIFVDRGSDGWLDQQGVPNTSYQPFQNGVLPHIISIADILSANTAAQPMNDIDTLLVAYRDFLQGKP